MKQSHLLLRIISEVILLYPYLYRIEPHKKQYVLHQIVNKDTILCGTIYKEKQAHWKTLINTITILSLQDTFPFSSTLCAYNTHDQEIVKIQPKFSLHHLSFELKINHELFLLQEHKDELLRSVYTCTLNDAEIIITSNFKEDYFIHIAAQEVAMIQASGGHFTIQANIQDENLLLLIASLYLTITQ